MVLTYGSGVRVYWDTGRMALIESGTRFEPNQSYTLYAERIADAHYFVDYSFNLEHNPLGNSAYTQWGSGSDRICLCQEAIVIGIDGTDSAGIKHTLQDDGKTDWERNACQQIRR